MCGTCLLLARQTGLAEPQGRRLHSRVDVIPLFETLDDLEAGPGHHGSLVRRPALPQYSARAPGLSRSDAGLFGLRQRRRLRSGELGAVSRAEAPGAGGGKAWRALFAVPWQGRHHRSWGRAIASQHSSSAIRGAGRPPAHYRTGRSHLAEIFESGDRGAQYRAVGDLSAGCAPSAIAPRGGRQNSGMGRLCHGARHEQQRLLPQARL